MGLNMCSSKMQLHLDGLLVEDVLRNHDYWSIQLKVHRDIDMGILL